MGRNAKFVVMVLIALGGASVCSASEAAVDFSRDIQPIFRERCVECHNPEKQKGGLRLDKKSSAFKGGDSGQAAIVPGKTEESVLLKRITSSDSDEIMPPKGEKLTTQQVDLIRKWIAAGAPWPEQAERKHWAYLKPARPALPKVKQSNWARNGVDYFVLSRLEQEKIRPAPEASKGTLLRRVSLDLTGLPPTPADLEAFLNDKSPFAYERAVDRLLSSPAYGERWARPWLDLARYADTQGYEKDNRRSMWPWRDWVINALNRDLPFDQFTVEQMAGDMLPDATREQKIATGFHRNTMTNTEGGTDNEEFRHEALIDRINTTMSVWMGTTFACAQCHNHKYDPFQIKEYYRFYAFLNNTADADNDDEAPTIKVPSAEQTKQLEKLRQELKAVESDLNSSSPRLAESEEKWEQKLRPDLRSWRALPPTWTKSAGGATLIISNDASILATGTNPSNDVYSVELPGVTNRITAFRLEVLPDDSLPKKSLGRHPNGSFVLSQFEAAIAAGSDSEDIRAIKFIKATADFTQEGHSVTNLIDGKTGPGWAVGAAEEKNRVERSAYFFPAEPIDVPSNGVLRVTLRHSSKFTEANVGRFRISVSSEDKPRHAPQIPSAIASVILKEPEKRSEAEGKQLTKYYRSVAPELQPLRERIAFLKKREAEVDKSIPITSVMQELEKPRETFLRIRGGYLSKGEKVQAGVPEVLHPFPDDLPRNRLGVAKWLVDTNNPLTARVVVNRFWEQFFGIGIVETTQDFGLQGDKPSHPELLDWLATEFMAGGWSMKKIQRTIVTSAAYRQSSKIRPELQQRDPYNRLIARGPRVRMEAEMIRDQALAVSGLLAPKVGGPPVMPPQPEGLWQVVYSGDKWETSKGMDKYRRGLYTFWRRTLPYPSMVTFDAPSREFCVVSRSRSNTPLQALTLLNDPAYVEAAQALARRIVSESAGAPEQRIAYAFQICLGRKPRAAEVSHLTQLYRQELLRFKEYPKDAEKMACSELGKPRDGVEMAELASWTVIANVLLNLDEMITKG